MSIRSSLVSLLLLVSFCVANGFNVNLNSAHTIRASSTTSLKATELETKAMPEVTVGDKIPAIMMGEGLADFNAQKVNIAELIAGKKVAIFGVPGAFTPGCSKSHLPSFIEAQESLKAKGVEMTICIATNDSFVMEVSLRISPSSFQ